jgi:hypothetical protein
LQELRGKAGEIAVKADVILENMHERQVQIAGMAQDGKVRQHAALLGFGSYESLIMCAQDCNAVAGKSGRQIGGFPVNRGKAVLVGKACGGKRLGRAGKTVGAAIKVQEIGGVRQKAGPVCIDTHMSNPQSYAALIGQVRRGCKP